MKRFQVKCRRCRHWLMGEDSIVDCHGDSVQGDQGSWHCGKEQGQRTHLFVSSALPPPFIHDAVEQACYTQGKLHCPKCQGRLGSFDLVRLGRKCACGQSPLPPIHLLLDRVDLLPSSTSAFLDTVVTPAPLALSDAGQTGLQISHNCHTLTDADTGLRGSVDTDVGVTTSSGISLSLVTNAGHMSLGENKTDCELHEPLIKPAGCVSPGSAAAGTVSMTTVDRSRLATDSQDDQQQVVDTAADSVSVLKKTTLHENQIPAADASGVVVVGVTEVNDTQSSDNDDEIVKDLHWLFAQSPPTGDGSDSVTETSEDVARCCAGQRCRHLYPDHHTCLCPNEEESSMLASGRTDSRCITTKVGSTRTLLTPQRTANTVSGSQRVRLYRENYCPDRTTASLDSSDLHRPRPVIATLSRDIIPKSRRRERRRNRDPLDMSANNVNADCLPEPDKELLVPRFKQRQIEKRDWEESERRQQEREEVSWEHSCPVCLDVLFSPYTTRPCAHNFCQGCLRQLSAAISPDKCICPLCRRKIAECAPNTELEVSIQDKYPAHLRRRRREEKRHQRSSQAHRWRTRHAPLPGLPFPQRLLSKLPTRADGRRYYLTLFRRASSRRQWLWLAVVAISIFLVVALSSLGLEICKHVLARLATVYDDLTERLTGERLWSRFLGVESRTLTVSCVFVLYLLVASVVHYLQLFQYIIRI